MLESFQNSLYIYIYITNEKRKEMGKLKGKKMDKLKFFSPLYFIIKEFHHLDKAMGGVVPHHGMQHNEPTTTLTI